MALMPKQNAVNQIIDNGGQPVDLGYNITGYKQGAAGSSYLSWQEGNWSLVVRASNINGESPDDLAKMLSTFWNKKRCQHRIPLVKSH